MGEVISDRVVLSDSTFKTRPDFATNLRSDANAGYNSVKQIEEQRRLRLMKFPTLAGRADVDSFQNKNSIAYKKWNDEGDFRPVAPFRSYDNIVDPVSGFVSAGGDADRQTGIRHIPTMVALTHTPQSQPPHEKHSVRVNMKAAPLETRRKTEEDSGSPSLWNSRKLLDVVIRNQLGGWTSDVDPRKVEEVKQQKPLPHTGSRFETDLKSKEIRDKLALKYMYTSSTQRSYEDIPWDNKLIPKLWSSATTLEERPDMLDQRWTLKRYEPRAEEWQCTGRAWDWFQTRKAHYKPKAVVFTSEHPRTHQIPLYSGCIGGVNLDEIDNRDEPFNPLTVKRNAQPWYTETAHRPNIPHYKGCTYYERIREPAHTTELRPQKASTLRVHRQFPINPNPSVLIAPMSKMITTVPPNNPFNKVEVPHVTC